MRAVDCFCASGGLTCGLKAAGVDVAMGTDVDRAALKLYRARHAHPAIELDLSDVSSAVQAIREVGPIDLLAGSPPCTDFSSAGHREERTRVAGLTVDFARIAVSLRVPCVLLENVPELLRSQAWAEARDVLVGGGYSLIVLRVNAAACEVAQIRRRVFVIAMLNCNTRRHFVVLRKRRLSSTALQLMLPLSEAAWTRTPTLTFTMREIATARVCEAWTSLHRR